MFCFGELVERATVLIRREGITKIMEGVSVTDFDLSFFLELPLKAKTGTELGG